MIKTVRRLPPVAIQPRPTLLQGVPAGAAAPPCGGCGERRNAAVAGLTLPIVGEVSWPTLLLAAAVAYILFQHFWNNDKRKEKRKKLTDARAQYQKRLAQIRKGS